MKRKSVPGDVALPSAFPSFILFSSIKVTVWHGLWAAKRLTPFSNYLNLLIKDRLLTDRRETFSETAAVVIEHRYQSCPANPLKQKVNSFVY